MASALPIACSSSSSSPPPRSPPSTRSLVLLHTTDEHSHFIGRSPELDDFPAATTPGSGAIVGGIGRRAKVLAEQRTLATAAGAATLTLSAGDNLMGTLAQVATTTRAPDYKVMKALGYDATTFGNHEFDFGPDALARSIEAASSAGGAVPTVATNIHFAASDAGDDRLAALFDESGADGNKPVHRSLVLTASNGLRVGLVGIVGAGAASYAAGKAPVTFSIPPGGKESDHPGVLTQLFAEVQPVIDHLRNDEHVDLVVALSHSGLETATAPFVGEDVLIAQYVSGIDVIVSGHSHLVVPLFQVPNTKTGKPVFVQQAGPFGSSVGRISVKVAPNGAVSVDANDSPLLPIDDHVVSEPAFDKAIDAMIREIEADRLGTGLSYLEQTLSAIEGAAVTDDPARAGDLYFRPIGKTGFDLRGLGLRVETPVSVLSADAMLAAADAYASGKTDVAVQAMGNVRADIAKGRTGTLSFADLFGALPLGVSPTDGTSGQPLVRFAIYAVELKAALEVSASYSYTSFATSDYFLVPAGVRYEYDTSRPPFDSNKPVGDPANGRITKITLASNHASVDTYDTVLLDVANGGWAVPKFQPYTVVSNLFVAKFAYVAGVTLRNPDTGDPFASPEDAILKRSGDGSAVKDVEALASWVRSLSTRNGGTLPSRYDAADAAKPFPRRAICTGPLCGS